MSSPSMSNDVVFSTLLHAKSDSMFVEDLRTKFTDASASYILRKIRIVSGRVLCVF